MPEWAGIAIAVICVVRALLLAYYALRTFPEKSRVMLRGITADDASRIRDVSLFNKTVAMWNLFFMVCTLLVGVVAFIFPIAGIVLFLIMLLVYTGVRRPLQRRIIKRYSNEVIN